MPTVLISLYTSNPFSLTTNPKYLTDYLKNDIFEALRILRPHKAVAKHDGGLVNAVVPRTSKQ
jgi:hypothetical protein